MAKILGKYKNEPGMVRGTPGQGLASPMQQGNTTSTPSQPPAQNVSGSFTNLSNYLGANKQAGERIGSQLGKGIAGSLAGSQAESQKQVGALGQQLSSANTALQRGEGYQQELSKEGFDAQKFLQAPVPGTSGLVAGQQPRMETTDVKPGQSFLDRNNPVLNSTVNLKPATQSAQQSPTKLEDFTKFRTGTAVDQQALEKQRAGALGATATAQQQVGQKQKAIGSEAGRFGLLKDYLGNRNYRQGLQSLDQTFLQQQGQKSLSETEKNLRERTKALTGTTTNLETEQVKNIQDAIARQKTLSEGLTQKTGQLESKYMTDLEAEVAKANAKRAADIEKYEQFAKQITQAPSADAFTETKKSDREITTEADRILQERGLTRPGFVGTTEAQRAANDQLRRQYDKERAAVVSRLRQEETTRNAAARKEFEQARSSIPQLDAALLAESGLREGQQTFNVLNPNLQASDFIDFDRRTAERAQDIATQQNVDYYKALADLAGMSNAKLDRRGFLVGEDDALLAGAKMAQGEKSLGGRTQQALANFLKEAAGTNVSGQATESYGKRGFSSGSNVTRGVTMNAARELTGLPPEVLTAMLDNMSSAAGASAAQDLAGSAVTGGTWGAVKGGLDSLTGGAFSDLQNRYNQAVQNTLTDIGSNIGLWGGDGPSEAIRAATMHATAQAQAQLQDYLRSKGFGNYITSRGVASTTGPLTGEQFGYRGRTTTATGGAGKDQTRVETAPTLGMRKDYIPQQFLNLPTSEEV